MSKHARQTSLSTNPLTAREIAFIQYMVIHSKFSIREIADMWGLTLGKVKYCLRLRVIQTVNGYKIERKQYDSSLGNRGWTNLIPGGYRGEREK
jgi:hypothetical protein